MKISSKTSGSGFTLVELLVVIVIVAALAAISITMVFRFRNSADKVVSIENLRQIQTANVSFATENNGRFVPPQVTVEERTYDWFENPEFVSQLKGEDATYGASGDPDTSLPLSLMDPSVVRKKTTNYNTLAGSYGYTRPQSEDPLHMARLTNESRSAAFITADEGFVAHSTSSRIAYRNNEKAVVVYYDGHASTISRADIDGKGGASDIFWQAVQ